VLQLSRLRRQLLGLPAPLILALMARIMLCPPGPMVRYYDIPEDVVKQAYGSPEFKKQIRECVGKVRDLLAELGVINPINKRLWIALGIWDEPRGRAAKV